VYLLSSFIKRKPVFVLGSAQREYRFLFRALLKAPSSGVVLGSAQRNTGLPFSYNLSPWKVAAICFKINNLDFVV
jgi:hypothetical protein